MKKTLLLASALLACMAGYAQKTQKLTSPDGSLCLEVKLVDTITYDVSSEGIPVLSGCGLSLDLGDVVLGQAPRLRKATRKSVDENLHPFLSMKYSTVRNSASGFCIRVRLVFA